jgi:geranylgeranyl diphosphate synthase, type I
MSAAPLALVRHTAALEQAIERASDALGSELRALDPALAPAADALADALGTGKRLRPALVCWAFGAHGGTHEGGAVAAVMGAAVAVELVHTCALVHDDVIDRSPTRRGLPSVHTRFAQLHGTGWSGDADGYGTSVAILLGDVLLAAADAHLLAADVAPDALAAAHDVFTRMRIEVMAGQFLDVDAAARGSESRERALSVATLKSGRYSVSRPLQLGALLAGASRAEADALAAVGDPLGRAFQLVDDLLGVFGDPAETGKPNASDLAEGKRTLLVAETLARSTGADRTRFLAGLGDADLTEEDAALLRTLMERCGARTAVEQAVAGEVAAARRGIDALGLAAHARDELHGLAGWLVDRRS